MTDETPAKPKIVWPAGVKDVTEQKLGQTIVIIGYPGGKPKPAPEPEEEDEE